MQRALEINTLQLMLKQMPLSAALLLPVIVLTEDVTSGSQPLVSVVFTPQLLGMIVLTAVMAFFVNVSTFYIIAELSAIRSSCPPSPPTRPFLPHIALATTCWATARLASLSLEALSCSARWHVILPLQLPHLMPFFADI